MDCDVLRKIHMMNTGPILECAATVWSLHLKSDVELLLERV